MPRSRATVEDEPTQDEETPAPGDVEGEPEAVPPSEEPETPEPSPAASGSTTAERALEQRVEALNRTINNMLDRMGDQATTSDVQAQIQRHMRDLAYEEQIGDLTKVAEALTARVEQVEKSGGVAVAQRSTVEEWLHRVFWRGR